MLEVPYPPSNYPAPTINFSFSWGYRFSDLSVAFLEKLAHLHSDHCDRAARQNAPRLSGRLFHHPRQQALPPLPSTMLCKQRTKHCSDLWSPSSQEPLTLLIYSCSCFLHSPYLHMPASHPYVSSFSDDHSSPFTFASLLFMATAPLIIPLFFLLHPMPHEPAIPPPFLHCSSFILFLIHPDTSEHLCSSWHLQTFFLLPFSTWSSLQIRSHFTPFHTCVSDFRDKASWFQSFPLLSEFWLGSWVDSSPLLASEDTMNSSRKKM